MTRQRPITRAIQPHEFDTEKLASAYIKAQLEPKFYLLTEAQLEHWSGKKLKIDYLAAPKSENKDFRSPLIGIEVKRGYTAFRDFSSVLRQAIDYRGSTITDKRAKKFQGAHIPYVFVFPSIAAVEGSSSYIYQAWMKGAIRLAGQFNVGVIDDQTFWLSGHPWWSLGRGHYGLDTWWTADKVGAR